MTAQTPNSFCLWTNGLKLLCVTGPAVIIQRMSYYDVAHLRSVPIKRTLQHVALVFRNDAYFAHKIAKSFEMIVAACFLGGSQGVASIINFLILVRTSEHVFYVVFPTSWRQLSGCLQSNFPHTESRFEAVAACLSHSTVGWLSVAVRLTGCGRIQIRH